MKKYNSIFLGINILLAIGLVTGASMYASFQDNNQIPPNNNTSAPINTSATPQVKQGSLTSNGLLVSNAEVQAPVFRSSQNGGYYVHPVGSSRLVNVYADHVYTYGHINAPDIYIRNAGRWASQLGRPSGPRIWRNVYQLNHPAWADRWLQCADNEVMTGMYYNPHNWHILVQCRSVN